MRPLHTPGPFRVSGDGIVAETSNVVIARVNLPSMGPAGEREASYNATLFAASPKLLASLDWAMQQIGPEPHRIRGQNDSYCDAYADALNALAEARGALS